ncbi:MAG: redoxin domain-containing protein [Planctomycetota bacterium]
MQQEKKHILIVAAMLLGIALYICVMLLCLLHEGPSEESTASQRQEARAPRKEDVTVIPAEAVAPTAAKSADVKTLTSSERLHLSGTQTTDTDLAQRLEGLTSLGSLYLGATRITDAGLGHLKNLTALQNLCVHKMQVTDTGLAHLKGLTRLQSLCLNDTQVSDAGLIHLKGLTSLRQLKLFGTKVSTAGVAELKRVLPNCRISGSRAPLAGRAESPLIGKLAPSFTLKDLNGKQVSLSDFKGKVVLLDFWATWCGPCVAEMPNVQRVYSRYHDDGFEVVGVSLDKTKEALTRFVEEKQVSWPQIFFDEDGSRGWNNPLGRKYGIRSIPNTYLVDREGKVSKVNVRGRALELAVAEILGREPATQEDIHRYDLERLSRAIEVNPDDAEAYHQRAHAYVQLEDYVKAAADLEEYRKFLETGSHPAVAYNNLAWYFYLTGPKELRNPQKALALALKAVALQPSRSAWRNTLGVAYYRLGQFDEAVETLQAGEDGAFDFFFLAMSYQQLGQPEKAKEAYEKAIQWWEERKPLAPNHKKELTAFRAEADALLGGN